MRLLLGTCLATAALLASACGHAATPPTGGGCRAPLQLVALTDLGSGLYHGFQGGLYPGGKNTPPARYLAKGRAAAAHVIPRGPAGRPSPNGRIVLLSIGMSNAEEEFGAFDSLAARSDLDPHLTIVDGAQGHDDARMASDPESPDWNVVLQRLNAAGVTPLQVQAVWLKEAIAFPSGPFPSDAQRLQSDLGTIVAILHHRFPNLRLVYVSSRTYGGYSKNRLNPEPYAYDSGFAVKWLIQQRIDSRQPGPWLGWGPYLWADGTNGRRDGFDWTCQDVGNDGTHPSAAGSRKIGEVLLGFFRTDPTARPWFVG